MGRNGGKKTGGRVKGSLNKTTKLLFDLVEEKGLDPIEGLEQALQELDGIIADTADEKLGIIKAKIGVYSDLLQYMYPKRKAVEHIIPPESKLNRIVKIEWADENADSHPENEETDSSSASDQ